MAAATAHERTMPRWQRSLLPAMLGADHADRGQPGGVHLPRSPRDWLVDLVLFAFALVLGAAGAWSDSQHASTPVLVVVTVLGVCCCLALWVRRDHPLAVAVATVAASAVSAMAGGAAIVAIFTVAIYCVPRRTIQVTLLAFASWGVYAAMYTTDGHYRSTVLVFGLIATVAAAAFGLFVRARRELVLSLHERNRRLQAEQEWHVEEARRAERNRIAREMHDVLAHRISLLSLHAGALEFRPDAPPEEIARAAEVIRVSARAAQEDLREVIGVLRADAHDEPLEPPQPTLSDLTTLVSESQRAGMRVTLRTRLEPRALPETLGRTVYRLIQEGLTNARKHAPEQLVTVELTGGDSTVRVTVSNRPPVRAAAADPGTGGVGPGGAGPKADQVGSRTGLIGLGERVALAGGSLRHAPLPGGGFELVAELPWS